MQTLKNWYRAGLGISLLLLLGVPTFVPSAHEILHLHDHHHCTDHKNIVHLGSEDVHCDLCDYLISFKYTSEITICSERNPIPDQDINEIEAILWNDKCDEYHHLRGPPPA